MRSRARGEKIKITIIHGQSHKGSTYHIARMLSEKLGIGVAAVSWDVVSPKKKRRIEKETSAITERIIRNSGNMRPSTKTRVFFNVMRMLQRKGWNEADIEYWKEKGWDGHDRPWKK